MNKESFEAIKKLVDAELSEDLKRVVVLTDEQKANAEEELETALKVILYAYIYIIRAGRLARAGFHVGDVVRELAAIANDLEYWYPQLKNNGHYFARDLWTFGNHLNTMEMLEQKGDK